MIVRVKIVSIYDAFLCLNMSLCPFLRWFHAGWFQFKRPGGIEGIAFGNVLVSRVEPVGWSSKDINAAER